MQGKLYICPTPIGNLEDITLRTLNTLREVDLIAAEDTRHSIKLLNYFEIKKPMISYYEHNKKSKGEILIGKLLSGESIGLITDAGMPGISDPGEDIIKSAIENNIEIIGLPGPTASITALVVSGLSTDKFVFEGFLPPKNKDRIRELERLKTEERTIILYEAPHRILSLLENMEKILGNRQIAIARELTKIHEEVFRGNVIEAKNKYKVEKPRGEFVIIVEGGIIPKEEINIREEIIYYMEEGFSKKDAVKKVVETYDLPRNTVYKESLNL